jgi:tRNA/tmRNA/rRNA uracil-C5-methylase (TrmA/RlmC/RlmD family)
MILDVGPIAPGGHCVARTAEGQVVFVRHALPGERVRVEVTEEHPGYLRADAVEVLSASPDRVAPPCPYAGVCGGCDFQHVAPAAQRELTAAVVREQLTRLAGLSVAEVEALGVRVAELPGGPLGWRTRVRYTVNAAGQAGLLAHRSHQVVPVDRCRIAHPVLQDLPVTAREWPEDNEVSVAVSATGEVAVVGDKSGLLTDRKMLRERALGRDWRVGVDGFWQVHPAAADTLAQAVLELLRPQPGERAWDLYGGAGLFAAALAAAVGPDGSVVLVESDRAGAEAARENLADLGNVEVVRSSVERFRPPYPPDVVVLDPPRAGAGGTVVRTLVAARPRAVGYVSCDPASFSRDVATFARAGWRLAALRGFDAFPMTHHVELVGLLVPENGQDL